MDAISRLMVLLIFIFIGAAGLVYAGGPECGDGIVQEPEECDDGNIINGDGCNVLCQLEFCGDGIVQAPEQCDDGNIINGDGCNVLCQLEFCGDGIVQEPEECDDGNIIRGDGCSAACTFDFGDEGCRPRYWKKEKHFGSWTAPFTTDTLFSSVFEDAFPGKSLLQVLNKEGDGLKGLGRHAVAALLNAASADIAYDRTVRQVIVMFNNVYPGTKHDHKALKNVFKALNELGCPLRIDENDENGNDD